MTGTGTTASDAGREGVGAALEARRSGREGGPPLVVLHGLFGSLDNFHSVSLHLGRHVGVTRLDLPGHGRSPTLPRLGIGEMAESVAVWLDANGVERCHLLGHSLGGKVAMALAGSARAPALESLIVVDIAPRRYPPLHAPVIAALGALDLDTLADRREADRRLRANIGEAGVRAFLLKSLERGDDGRFRWRFDLEGIARDYPLMCEAPEVERVIEAPTLFVKGGTSDYLGAADEAPIRRVCARPSFREIGGAGHWPHAEKPALFARLCLGFIGAATDGGAEPTAADAS